MCQRISSSRVSLAGASIGFFGDELAAVSVDEIQNPIYTHEFLFRCRPWVLIKSSCLVLRHSVLQQKPVLLTQKPTYNFHILTYLEACSWVKRSSNTSTNRPQWGVRRQSNGWNARTGRGTSWLPATSWNFCWSTSNFNSSSENSYRSAGECVCTHFSKPVNVSLQFACIAINPQ